MPNPSGVNSFNRFQAEPPYGQVSEQSKLAQSYPIPGQAPLSAPKKAQRRAVKGQGVSPEPVAQPTPLAPTPQVSAQQFTAQTWAQIAQIPGITPYAALFAQKANG